MAASVDIVPVSSLFGKEFYIPNYQRGYRWEKQEITDLLKDLYLYTRANFFKETTSKFYCLQPLVVKQRTDGKYEVIDGQQRLTTIYLIINYLNNKNPFKLTYETRTNCESFFEDRKYLQIVTSNPDYYHISKGYSYIQEWFESFEDETDKDQAEFFLKQVINTKDKFSASFIWYETEQDSIELFTSMNEGKIGLTDSELIKALLFQSDKYKKAYADGMHLDAGIKQAIDNMSSEWDAYSCKLQDDKFWYFLSHKNEKAAKRLEYIFNLLAEKWNSKDADGHRHLVSCDDGIPKHYVYLVFEEKLKSLKNSGVDSFEAVKTIWKEVKEYITILEEWFNDNEWYHLFGYYVAVTKERNAFKDISSLLIKFSDRSVTKEKDSFKNEIKSKIGEHIKLLLDKKQLKDFAYHDPDNTPLIDILLLFNIDSISTCNNENSRFPFDVYTKYKVTSLEHIHPQNPQNLEEHEEEAIRWMKITQSSMKRLELVIPQEKKTESDRLQSKITTLLESYSREEFISLYNDYYKFYNSLINNEKEDSRKEFLKKEFPNLSEDSQNQILQADLQDTIFNLALVDKDTNSAINNSSYDAKRDILNKRESANCYIPLCTRRVFAKYYSPESIDILYWQPEDRIRYFIEIKKVVDRYVKIFIESKKKENENA